MKDLDGHNCLAVRFAGRALSIRFPRLLQGFLVSLLGPCKSQQASYDQEVQGGILLLHPFCEEIFQEPSRDNPGREPPGENHRERTPGRRIANLIALLSRGAGGANFEFAA